MQKVRCLQSVGSKLGQAIQVASSALSLSRYRISLEQREFFRKKTKRKKRWEAIESSNSAGFVGPRSRLRLGILRLALTEEKTRTRASCPSNSSLSEIQSLLLPRWFYPRVEWSSGWAICRRYWRRLLLEWQITPRHSPTFLRLQYTTILSLLWSLCSLKTNILLTESITYIHTKHGE